MSFSRILVSNSSVNELYGLYLQRRHNEKQSKQGLKVHLSTLVTVTTCCYGAMATALKDLSLEYSLIELQQVPCLKIVRAIMMMSDMFCAVFLSILDSKTVKSSSYPILRYVFGLEKLCLFFFCLGLAAGQVWGPDSGDESLP